MARQDPTRDDAAARFVERFATVLADAGMPRMPARVLAALLASDAGRMTAAELAAALHASPAAISGAVRYLTQVDLVTREREPGSRRDHYAIRDNAWYEASLRRDAMLRRWAEELQLGLDELGPATPAGERLRESLDFILFLRDELPALLERWRQQRAAR
jgi:DNA-binding transcriptional regulator GbsR (MarR family)